jgi:copper homeostasis protein
MAILLEAVCCSALDCEEAEAGGADRIELCAAIELGGLTPSLGLLQEARARTRLPIACMIRPRAGAFCYGEADFAAMRRDVATARAHGAAAVVFGVLTARGTIDVARMRQLVDDAGPLDSVCHRAFDVTPDAPDALDALVDCGVRRVLTSGQSTSALEGAARIAVLVGRASGRIAILAGGGIRAASVEAVVRATGVREVHGGPFRACEDGSGRANPALSFGPAGGGYQVADREALRAIRDRLDALASGEVSLC